jgi:hypothetical protein
MQQAAIILGCGSLIFVDFEPDRVRRIFTVNNIDEEIDWSFGEFVSAEIYSIRKVIGMLK